MNMERVKVAAVQAGSVFLDLEATLEKACGLIKEVGSNGARLAVFPESLLPAYPDWVWRASPWDEASSKLFARMLDNAVVAPGPVTERLGEAAREAGCFVAMGVTERDGSTLYNTLLYVSAGGEFLGKHRKLMPTGPERLVWGMGDGSTLISVDTPFGRVGGLICWENYMPLARAAMFAQGIDIYVAPTWDNSEVWIATMRHIAKEGRVYVIGVSPCVRGSDVPADTPGRELWGDDGDLMSKGNSVIVGPDGSVLAGPLVGEEGVVYAEVDASKARASRHQFDPVGHYARPDVLRLEVDTRPQRAVEPADG